MDQAQWLARLVAGDPSALEALLTEYGPIEAVWGQFDYYGPGPC